MRSSVSHDALKFACWFDLAALPKARLAPDMYPLTKHVRIACDHTKDAQPQA
jgi:hypothetical protein